jgi:hypothetical protein
MIKADKGTEATRSSLPDSAILYIPEKPVKYRIPALSIKFTIAPFIRNPDKIAVKISQSVCMRCIIWYFFIILQIYVLFTKYL